MNLDGNRLLAAAQRHPFDRREIGVVAAPSDSDVIRSLRA